MTIGPVWCVVVGSSVVAPGTLTSVGRMLNNVVAGDM